MTGLAELARRLEARIEKRAHPEDPFGHAAVVGATMAMAVIAEEIKLMLEENDGNQTATREVRLPDEG